MIFISDKAKAKIDQLLSKEDKTVKQFLRVDVESGGCSGLSYKMTFDDKATEEDEVFEDKGIKIHVSKRSLLYLLGTTLQFSEGLNGKGFHFENPNASRTCACGESFSL